MKRELPSPDVLRQLLRYDPETGKLFWLERTIQFFMGQTRPPKDGQKAWNGRYAGKQAFTATDSHGYHHGAIFNVTHRAHRVAWAIQTSSWPDDEIDHINLAKNDNRWINLREATRTQNNRNLPGHRDTASGFKGVSWHSRDQLWVARICADRKQITIGYFKVAEDAQAAYAAESARLHGKYGRAK